MTFVAELVMCMVEFKIQIWIEWISTHRNEFADALSRHCIHKFRRLCQTQGVAVRPHPDRVVYPREFLFPRVSAETDEAEYRRFCHWARAPPSRREPRWWCRNLDSTFAALVPKPV